MASPAKKAKTLPVCPYGARCYRKNPDHLKEFDHPSKDGKKIDSKDAAPGSSGSLDSSTALPPCKYGASCYRKNLLHFAEYSHPTKMAKKDDSDSGNDTDVYSSDDEKKKKSPDKKVGVGDILKRGMSLVKNYSQMTEAERKELIKKAFEAKQELQKELQETKDEVKKKDQALEKLQDQVNTGLLLVDGEKEALKGDKTVYFPLLAERSYKEGSAAQTHFRLAESQFYRLLSGVQSSYRVSKVEYVVTPKLVQKFKEAREDLKKHRGEELSYPVLGFHGTKEENIHSIAEKGFQVPGEKGFSHRTDTGWYGKGVYFSEFPAYSMSYIQGASKLLLCQVLAGKVYNCTKLIHGHKLMAGYDSHTSPDKKELIIFNAHHILPSYIVHYKTSVGGDFAYDIPDDMKDIEKYFEVTSLQKKSMQAQTAKASKVFAGHSFTFTGTFSFTQSKMIELVEKHGGKKGTPSVFSFLVASPDEYHMKTNKCNKAISKKVPIAVEMFLYDSIISKKLANIDEYKY